MHSSEVRKRQQLSLQELYQLNWLLGAGLAVLSLWPAFYLDFPVLPHLWLATLLILASSIRPQVTTYLPKAGWQAVPFVIVLLLALDLRFSAEVVPALVRLNILLVLYRCLSFRRKREDLQLIVLCLFLVIISGVKTVAITYVVQVLLFTGVAMAFLFNITLMEDSREPVAPRDIWRDFTWGRLFRRLWAQCDGGFVAVAGLAFSSVIVSSILLFLLIPRFDINTSIPFLGTQRAAQTGFAEAIRFGDVTNIRNDSRVALRVEVTSDHEIPLEPYWRMLVLDQYTNGGFQISRAVQENSRKDPNLNRLNYNSPLLGAESPPEADNIWTFYLEGGVARYFPLTGRFQRLRLQEGRDMVYLPTAHVLGTGRVNSGLLVYRVENMEFSGILKDETFGTETLEHEWNPEVSIFPYFGSIPYPNTTMALPLNSDDAHYLEELADTIAGGEALTAVEFAARATDYLQTRHAYSMTYDLPRGRRDHVVRWLESGSPGHCEAFAGALILICRAAGIPARAVTGFHGGSWNEFENYFMVRNSDAHAWVEIFDGQESWIRFDPTPGGGGAGGDVTGIVHSGGLLGDSSFAAYVDSLRIIWYRRIVNFDKDSQVELWALIQAGYSRISIREWFGDAVEFVSYWWKAPWGMERLGELVGLVAIFGLSVFLVAFCTRHTRIGFFQLPVGDIDPIRRKAGRYLQRMRALSPPRGEPELFNGVLFQLEQLRFGPPGRDENWRQTLRQARRIARDERRRRRKIRTSDWAGA